MARRSNALVLADLTYLGDAACMCDEACVMRRIAVLAFLVILMAGVAFSLAFTAPQPREGKLAPPRIAAVVVAASGEKPPYKIPILNPMQLSRMNPLLTRAKLVVFTSKAASETPKQLVEKLLDEGKALLVLSRHPCRTLLGKLAPGPAAPLTLLPLATRTEAGLNVHAEAMLIEARPVGGKLIPHYVVYAYKPSLGEVLKEVTARTGRQLPTKPIDLADFGTNIAMFLDRWEPVGTFKYIKILKVPFFGESVPIGRAQIELWFYYDLDSENKTILPQLARWLIIAYQHISVFSNVSDEVSLPAHILGGWNNDPEMLKLNITRWPDELIEDYSPFGTGEGPVKISVSLNVVAGTQPQVGASVTFTISDGIYYETRDVTLGSRYFREIGGARDARVSWLWGNKALSDVKDAEFTGWSYIDAPVYVPPSLYTSRPPGLFMEVDARNVLATLIGLTTVDDAFSQMFYVWKTFSMSIGS